MKKSIGLLGCFILLSNTAIFAGNIPGAVTVTVSDAYYHFDEKRKMDNSAMPNLAVAYNFNSHWAFEVAAGVLNTDLKPSKGDHGVHGMLYTVDGLYRFVPYGHLEPYVIAGIGMLSLSPNGDDSEHPGNINAGIGTQLFWGPTVAMRAEIRDIFDTTGETRNDYMINLGVSFLFGGEQATNYYKK